MPDRSRKQEVVEALFEHVRQTCPPDRLVFDNDLVKQISGERFANQFDATKFDTSEKLPQTLRDNDYFIVHLGGGRHQFVKGIEVGYHRLEPIPEGSTIEWPYNNGVLDDVVSNHGFFQLLNYRLLQDFLCGDAAATPFLFYPRRARVSFVHRVRGQTLQALNLPIYIHGALDCSGRVTVYHFVPSTASDYVVYRFLPQYAYFCNLIAKTGAAHPNVDVVCADILCRGGLRLVSLRRYAFANVDVPESIRAVDFARYIVTAR